MKHNREKIAPWVVTIIFILMIGSLIGTLIWTQLQVREVSGAVWFIGIYIVALAAMIVGIIVALRQRMKEINGGEEDEALQY